MAAPTDPTINDRIALAKGWRRVAYDDNRFHQQPFYWVDNANVVRGEQLPDFVGTLEGVSGMLRELNEEVYSPEQRWVWGWSKEERCYFFQLLDGYGGADVTYDSPKDKPGDCVGKAYEAERVYRWRGSTKETG